MIDCNFWYLGSCNLPYNIGHAQSKSHNSKHLSNLAACRWHFQIKPNKAQYFMWLYVNCLLANYSHVVPSRDITKLSSAAKFCDWCINFCMLGNFSWLFVVCWLFQNKLFQEIISRTLSECQTFWIQIRSDRMSGLICGPDLGPSCLHELSADNKSKQLRVYNFWYLYSYTMPYT